MEDYELDIVIGQGPSARSVKVPLQQFTLIGATTRTGLLTSPLRARFGIVHRLDFYTEPTSSEIVRRSARILGVPIDAGGGRRRSRGARAARRASPTGCCGACATTRRCAPTARSRSTSRTRALKLLEVDEHGFDEVDRRLLRTIIDKFGGGPVGVDSIAAAISEERDAIEDIYEPFLIQIGFLDRTPRGRVATARAYEYFGLDGAREGIAIVVTASEDHGPRRRCGRSTIAGLATYVPPRVLTNADLEKMVETTTSGSCSAPASASGTSSIRASATSDLGEGGRASRRIAQAGLDARRHRLHRRRHDDARHDVSEHRVPAAAQDRRAPRVGLRPQRRLLRRSPTR